MKKGITIGMDLGDKKHQVCILDEEGKIITEEAIDSKRRHNNSGKDSRFTAERR
jgi:predicted NBD/HSP70 family sugar kinase